MAIPTGAFQVTYAFSAVLNSGGDPQEVLNGLPMAFSLQDGGYETPQQINDRVESMMDSYLSSLNATYPASGNYEVNASRFYTCNQDGDTWPSA